MHVAWHQVTDLYDPREQWASYLINALKAKELQSRDINYIVRGQEVIIVDEFTGRTMPGRRWGDGLHQVWGAPVGRSLVHTPMGTLVVHAPEGHVRA